MNLSTAISLTPKRLIFFADPESLQPQETGEAGAGVSEEAAEAAAEERRQAAAAAKRSKKEERKAKKRDNKLASILEFFIHGVGRDDAMAILVTRLLQRNTPGSLLLAVLSLNYPEVNEVLENYLEEERDVLPDDAPEFQPDATPMALMEYGKELSEALALWTKHIFVHASFHPMKTILSLAHLHGVDHNMIQLSSLMIQQYFKETVEQEIDIGRIQEFSELFWKNTLKRLHQMAGDRGLLPDPSRDPLSEMGEKRPRIEKSEQEEVEDEEEVRYTKFQRKT